MEKQEDITHKMRSILIDWLVEVGLEYDMSEETIFLAVNFIDRFLSKMCVARTKLQLIGSTALFIAAKYEELQPPEVNDIVFITDETYTKSQVTLT
jgi:cyclin A